MARYCAPSLIQCPHSISVIAEADRLPRQHSHGVLQQESGARTYLAAAGEAAATNVGAPWNFVAGIANDAGNYILDRWRSLQSGDDSQGQSKPSTVRCVQRCKWD